MPPRTLFVDDHEDTRVMIVAVLGSGGYEVTTAGGSSDTPILFFSGVDPKLQREALHNGAQGFVLKPDFEWLREGIGRMMR